jgi:glycolate oxidase iron-sulfur subunit
MATVPTDPGATVGRDGPSAVVPRVAARDVVDYELLFDCVHCGLCLESCPTYVVTRAEMDSPRGRIYLMKGLAEGRLDLDRDAVRHLDLCLECRGCETACPSGVRYGRLIEHARGYIEKNWRRGVVERLRNRIISSIFPYPSRLRATLAPLRFVERLGMRGLLRTLLPAPARDWLDLLPTLTEPVLFPENSDAAAHLFGRREQEQNPHPMLSGKGAGEEQTRAPSVVVHHGCVAQVLNGSANLNSERVLAAAGYRVVQLAKTVCCGALDIHHGNLERAREFARTNVAALATSGADSIISAASGCSAVIAQYGELLKDDSGFSEQAREVSTLVTDLSSLLLDGRSIAPLPLSSPATQIHPTLPASDRGRNSHERARSNSREFRATVTYHDSCHLVHGLGVREQPRELLSSIPGVRLVELAESDLCCGSAGSYNLTEHAMARELARRKADNIIATGAEYVVLSNPGCEFQIAAELKRRTSMIKVVHIADFLALSAAVSA